MFRRLTDRFRALSTARKVAVVGLSLAVVAGVAFLGTVLAFQLSGAALWHLGPVTLFQIPAGMTAPTAAAALGLI